MVLGDVRMVPIGPGSGNWTRRARLFTGGVLATVILLIAVANAMVYVNNRGSVLGPLQWAGLGGVTIGGTLLGWFGLILPSLPQISAIEVGPASIRLRMGSGEWIWVRVEGPGPILSTRPLRTPKIQYGLAVMLQITALRAGRLSISVPISDGEAIALAAALIQSGFERMDSGEVGRDVIGWGRG